MIDSEREPDESAVASLPGESPRVVLNLTQQGSERTVDPTKNLSAILKGLTAALEELRERYPGDTPEQGEPDQSHQRYKELFDFAPVAFLETDPLGEILEANQRAAEILGVRQIHLPGKPFAVFIADLDRRVFRQRTLVAAEGTAVRGMEFQIVPRHRPPFFAEVDVSPVTGERGEVRRLVWLVRDLTERKLNESLLREGDARLRILATQVPAIIWTTDSDLRITGLQGSGLESLGLRPDRLLGASLGEFLGKDDPEYPPLAGHRRSLAGEHVEFEMQWGERPFRVTVEPLTTRDGTIEGCVGVALDVSEDVRVRDALEAALDREMKASTQLRAMDEMKDLLLRTVSHDLRNPLTSVLGYAATLERLPSLDTDQARNMIRSIIGNAGKIERLVEDFLDLDRLDRRILLPQRTDVDLGKVAQRVIASMDLGPRPVTVDAQGHATVDEKRLERILDNLIGDCVQHTPADVPVWVVMAPIEGGGARIVVEDAGAGFPDELKERAFEPFARGADAPSGGVGLGLTIVARFAELHGGSAWIEDRPGGGASFHVTLPGPEGSAPPNLP